MENKAPRSVHLFWALKYTCPTACLTSSPTPTLPVANLCLLLPELLISLCPSQNSLPFPLPKENRTSYSLPLDTYTHPALSSPRFLASADSLNLGRRGRGGMMRHPASWPCVSGNCSWMPLATPCLTSTHNPSRLLVTSQPKARDGWEGKSPGGTKPCQNKGR